MLNEIYFVSDNPEKIRVVRKVWRYQVLVKTPSEISMSIPQDLEVGTTYEQNAYIKALWFHNISQGLTIADDSGMEIAGLQGKPGVFTRRWAGTIADETDLIDKTIYEIQHLSQSQRVCDFVICAIAILDFRTRISVIERDSGVLLTSPRGMIVPGHPLASLLWITEKGASLSELVNDSQFQSKDIRAHIRLKNKILNLID